MSADSMQAIVVDRFGGPEVLRAVETARPEPLPTEVLVRVVAAGVNPVDVKTRRGDGVAPCLGRPPFILGWDVSGVVEETGFGVHTVAVGDEVYGMPFFPRQAGGYAQYVAAPARQFARKPVGLTHAEAAAVPLAALTAWQVLVEAASVQSGMRVLIHGAAGGVGHFAVQIARHLGAYVIGTTSSAAPETLRRLGVDEPVVTAETCFDEVVEGVDVVVDLLGEGDHATTSRSIRTLRPGGTLVSVADALSARNRELARRGRVRALDFIVEPDGVGLAALAGLLADGSLRVEVAGRLPLAAAAEAHRCLEVGHIHGKLVLEPEA